MVMHLDLQHGFQRRWTSPERRDPSARLGLPVWQRLERGKPNQPFPALKVGDRVRRFVPPFPYRLKHRRRHVRIMRVLADPN
jgi:hypothetical protein